MKKYYELSELEKYKIKNHIGSLAKLVLIDGKLSKSEVEIMTAITERYGFPKTELIEMIREGHETQYLVPSTTDEKLEQLYDFISVTLADKNIDIKELDLCKNIAKSLTIKEEKINEIIMQMITHIQKDLDYKQVAKELHKLL